MSTAISEPIPTVMEAEGLRVLQDCFRFANRAPKTSTSRKRGCTCWELTPTISTSLVMFKHCRSFPIVGQRETCWCSGNNDHNDHDDHNDRNDHDDHNDHNDHNDHDDPNKNHPLLVSFLRGPSPVQIPILLHRLRAHPTVDLRSWPWPRGKGAPQAKGPVVGGVLGSFFLVFQLELALWSPAWELKGSLVFVEGEWEIGAWGFDGVPGLEGKWGLPLRKTTKPPVVPTTKQREAESWVARRTWRLLTQKRNVPRGGGGGKRFSKVRRSALD